MEVRTQSLRHAVGASLLWFLCLLTGCATRGGGGSGSSDSAAAPPVASPQSSDSAAPATSPTPQTFSVLTYNLYVGNEAVAADAQLLRELDATVVCLQETIPESQAVLREELADAYPHRAFHVGKVGNGPGVLSKLPFEQAEYVQSSQGYNGYWVGRFVVHGQAVQIVNVHLHPTTVARRGIRGALAGWANSEAVRIAEIDEIAALLEPELPVILAGDFNSISSGSTYDRVLHHGFADIFREGVAPPRGTPTFRGRLRGFPVPVRIDYVFRRGDLRAVHSRVVQGGASDHHPVMVVFALPAA